MASENKNGTELSSSDTLADGLSGMLLRSLRYGKALEAETDEDAIGTPLDAVERGPHDSIFRLTDVEHNMHLPILVFRVPCQSPTIWPKQIEDAANAVTANIIESSLCAMIFFVGSFRAYRIYSWSFSAACSRSGITLARGQHGCPLSTKQMADCHPNAPEVRRLYKPVPDEGCVTDAAQCSWRRWSLTDSQQEARR